MTDATAAWHGSSSLDGRPPPGRCRRLIRSIARGVGIGLATAAAAGALVTTGAVTAAWMFSTAGATNPNLNGKMRSGPAAIALADPNLVFAGVEDITGSTTVVAEQAPVEPAAAKPAAVEAAAADPADALAFATRWAGGMFAADMPVETAPSAPPPAAEPGFKLASLASPAIKLASLASPGQTVPPPAPPAPPKPVAPLQAHNKSPLLPEPDSHTAVYDIAAHTVYLPNGTKLEAHSGLGDKLDNPRYVNLKDRGPTPPNVYDLTLRGELFHEVRAIRLNPVGTDSMFGRDGILAHTYMLGANGQSNGCVSFKDYPTFLHAYLRGEIDRLVVVPSLGNTSWRTASARGTGRYADNNP
jgi:Protein of unknown function (DUF2778)